ncbi:Bowman-Birk serine protease inhibitor family protein, putative [Ichthyophthirius multifiliis]|uniref:Bowman-Birk serine protease inhibitor family protein, putative n=1 Tax=Ichthyophthirius multifiliis TaxID=5932 RepID=G0QQQ4_ICHMU|nr:Bowman-Birk serine protease inhibitor family protein, putative [Ichthyophthirius multifiliis]EGR32451.1 Bowman-Birk serine protease inhibitor family protein, putative [Ichthyophthirius multifiliis]|eukprot:XP_004036437.1 Bowman-Birk serine protease inhibitor family protein, putative [Ichthyophthirius multifiliis]
MKVNTTYNIQITASLKSDPTITQQILYPIYVLSDSPLVQLLGGNRQQQYSQSFNLEGKVDDPNLSSSEKILLKETNYGIDLNWQCISLSTGDKCRDSLNNLIVSESTQNIQITIQKKILQAYQQYQFKLSGTKNGTTVFDQIIILIVDYDVPSVYPTISINNSQNRINLNQEILTQFDYQGIKNADNLIITGVISYQYYQKNIISISHNQFRFQVWELLFDFLRENQNQFELKFSIRNIDLVVSTLISYTLNANVPPQDCTFYQNSGFKVKNLQDKQILQINGCIDFDQPLSYSFYFYKNQDDYNNEIQNAQYINRHLLSDFSPKNNIETVLPFGVSLIMGIIQDSKGGIRNITQYITVSQYDQESSSYYTFINNWFAQTKQNYLNENKVINYNMIIQDIINHSIILQLQENTQFIQIYINLLNEIQYLQTYFYQQTNPFNYFLQTQITLNSIYNNFLNQIAPKLGFDKIQQLINNAQQIIIDQQTLINKKKVISETTSYANYFEQIQVLILQAQIIQNIQQVDRNSFNFNQNKLLDMQYIQIMQIIQQNLNMIQITNENPIKVLNIITSQKITFKILKEKYLTLISDVQKDGINIDQNQESLTYQVNYLEYPSSIIKYDTNFPYPNNHSFIINEKTITFLSNQQQIPINIPLQNVYVLPQAVDDVDDYFCIQNIQDKGITQDCLLLNYRNDQNKINQFICQCKTQGKQTLVNDINGIFKKTIRSKDWYLYASVWTLVITTIIYIIQFLYLQQIDKIQDLQMEQSMIKRNQIKDIIFKNDITDDMRQQLLANIFKNDEQIIKIENQQLEKYPNQKLSIQKNIIYNIKINFY